MYPGARAEKCHLLHRIVEKFKSEQKKSGVKMPRLYILNVFHYLNAIYIHISASSVAI